MGWLVYLGRAYEIHPYTRRQPPEFPVTQNNLAFVSHQRLFHSDHTVREHLRLVAASHGLPPPVTPLVPDMLPLAERISQLSRAQRQTLALQAALLTQPDILLLDDMTRGLTPGAARQLWQTLRQAGEKRPFSIIYYGHDPLAVIFLPDVWQLNADQGWQRYTNATTVSALVCYTFTFARPALAHQFAQKLEALAAKKGEHTQHDLQGETIVFTLRETAVSLLNLLVLAGRDLHSFNQRPAETQATFFAVQYQETVVSTPLPALNWAKWRTAVFHIAAAEWKRHFRRVWYWANLILSAFYIILLWLLAVVLWEQKGMPLTEAAQIPLLFSSSLTIILAAEAFGRWFHTAQAEVLFHPAEAVGVRQPLALLAQQEMGLLRRGSILWGIGAGQLLVWGSHMVVFLLVWGLLQPALPSIGWSVAALVLWLLLALDGLAVGMLLTLLTRRLHWRTAVGGLGYVGVAFSFLYALRDGWHGQAVLWLWPFVGWPAALLRLADTSNGWSPLGFGLLGSVVLWVTAVYTSHRRPAVWSQKL